MLELLTQLQQTNFEGAEEKESFSVKLPITLAQPSLNTVAGLQEGNCSVNHCPASAYTLLTFVPWTKHVTAAKSGNWRVEQDKIMQTWRCSLRAANIAIYHNLSSGPNYSFPSLSHIQKTTTLLILPCHISIHYNLRISSPKSRV